MDNFWVAPRWRGPKQPWGQKPPPAPEDASERERGIVAAAFESWHPFTPYYRKTGDLIVVEVNLKDNVWYGSAKRKPGGPKSDAYWEALVEATKSWRRDVWSVIGDTDEFGLDD